MTGATPSGARELWQWNNTFLTVDWDNMFHSTNEKWLKPVRAHAGVSAAYDDPMVCGPHACPSETKAMKRLLGTPNVLGITKFEWYVNSPTGGGTIVKPWTEVKFQGGKNQSPHKHKLAHTQWKNVGRPATMTRIAVKGTNAASIGGPIDVTMDKALVNGHTYEVGIRATEIFGNQLIKKTTFRLDTTPPEIVSFGVTRGDEKDLAVHNLHDLSKMILEFRAFDLESSVRMVQWQVYHNTNEHLPHCKPGDVVSSTCDQVRDDKPHIGDVSEALTVGVKPDDCKKHPSATCVCTVAGDHCHLSEYKISLAKYVLGATSLDGFNWHGKNFTFALTATNRAGLFTTQRLVVQVDVTPPIAGAVNDSALGKPDIDYQQSRAIQGSFSGFTDPDSGIRAYM